MIFISLERKGGVDEAILLLRGRLEPSATAEAYALLAQLYSLKGDIDNAWAEIQKAVSIDKNDVFVLRNLARILLKKGANDDTHKIALAIYGAYPQDAENALLLGSVLSAMKKTDEALRLIQKSIELNPDYAEGYATMAVESYKLGRDTDAVSYAKKALSIKPHLYLLHRIISAIAVKNREFETALKSYEEFLTFEPQNISVMSDVGELRRKCGDIRGSVTILRDAIKLAPNDISVMINLATALQEDREVDEARAIFERVLSLNPRHTGALNNLSIIYTEMGEYDRSEILLNAALSLEPNSAETQNSMSALYSARNMSAAAYRHATLALEIEPGYTKAQLNLAYALKLQNRHELARQAYEKALSLDPNNAVAFIGLSDIANDEGDFETSTLLAQKALELDPDSLTALAVIAKNRKMDRDKDAGWLQRAFTLLDKNKKASPQERYAILFSIGKYYDDIKEYDRAFEYYKEANELKKSVIPRYDPKFEEEFAHNITRAYSYSNLAIKKDGSNDSSLPLFIIGMPRSGTSLTEQILSSHPFTFGAGELPFWSDMCAKHHDEFLRGEFEAKNLSLMASECITNLKERSKDKPEALRVVDKMPGNFHYIGLILSVFPNAKFIHAMRNPIDTCLSIYFQNFSASHSYSFDLNDLAHYYKEYHRLMEHWRAVLPEGVMLDVRYEDIVEDQEGWSRKIIEHIGLEWDDNCLDFHKTERKVGTASNWQVKQPIYKSSKERWRNYEKFVEPLRGLLEGY